MRKLVLEEILQLNHYYVETITCFAKNYQTQVDSTEDEKKKKVQKSLNLKKNHFEEAKEHGKDDSLLFIRFSAKDRKQKTGNKSISRGRGKIEF